jgi:hypothetical protein
MNGVERPVAGVSGISVGRSCSTGTRGCYAPVFKPSTWWACLLMKASYTILLTVLPIILVLTGTKTVNRLPDPAAPLQA